MLGVQGPVAILSKTIWEGLTDKVIFEQKLEGDQRKQPRRYQGKEHSIQIIE